MIIMKFGGTSVGNADNIINTVNIIKSRADQKPVVVVSAVLGITDKLMRLADASSKGKGDEILDNIIGIHDEILEKLGLDKSLIENDIGELSRIISRIKLNKKIDNKVLDTVQSFGEQMSSKIVAAQLENLGIKAQAFNAWELGLITNSDFGNAEPLKEAYGNLNTNIKQLDVIPVITGFIGKSKERDITTLGEGSSDYTASIIGNAIDANEIQIFKDVEGIRSADPRIVNNTKPLEEISFAEASELAYFGAQILHPKTILPAMRKNIPLKVLNSFDPKSKGTIIFNNSNKSEQIVKAIVHKKNITLINVESGRMLLAYGFLTKLFSIFSKYKKSVDVISTSEVSVSLTIDNEKNLTNILHDLEKIANVQILKNRAVICVIGEGMRNEPNVLGRTFTALGKKKLNVEMVSQGASKINTTFVVDGNDAETVIKVLHEEYFG